MNKKLIWLFVALTIVLVGCTKFYYQTPYVKFNHEEHVSVLFEEKKDCFYCHKLPDIETLINQESNFKISADLKIDNTCHTCHKDAGTKLASAPQNCYVCHDNLKTLKPEDHLPQWTKLHAVPATLERDSCSTCHSDWFCENCHSMQYSKDNYRHSRAFKLTHSVEAKIDPASCDSCHRVSFCTSCHVKLK